MRKKVIIGLLIVLVILIIALLIPKNLELKGDSEVILNLDEKYIEEGTNFKSEVTGTVDTSKEGEYTLVYKKGNQEVTRTVYVVDPSSLVVGLYGSQNTLVREGDPYIESGAFGIDKENGPVTEYKIKGEVDTKTPGKYEVTYTFNVGKLKKKVTRNVEVVAKDEFEANTDGVPVMMYHYVYTKENRPKSVNSNYILDTDFRKQLDYLKENNYYFPSFDELRAYVDGKIALPKNSAIITFDDGQSYFMQNGIPIMNEYKIPATAFIIGTKGAGKNLYPYATEYVSFETHSYDMHKAGGYIGHGGIISAMKKDEIVKDLQKGIKLVGSSNAFAFPFGDITEDGKKAVEEAGIDVAFSTVFGKVNVGDDYRALKRVRVNGGIKLEDYIDNL